jgi:hypothetical protein
MSDELLDELPSPPASEGTVGDLQTQPIDDQLDASLLTDVPKMGEPMPIGTYVFRMDSFKEQWTDKDWKTGLDLTEEQKQPYYALTWKCQQEPHVGRVVFENVPWVKGSDARDANSQTSPRRAEARSILNNRLPRAKELMQAAGFTPSGQFGFKDFLASNPEMKLVLKQKERQAKGPDGKFKGTGEWSNEVTKHLSLHRPA